MKLLIFIIIITLVLIIYFLKSKINQIKESFGNLFNTATTKYQKIADNLLVNSIQINSNNPLNITTELSGNIISAQDVSASNITLNTLTLKPNIVYNKFLLNNSIISNIQTNEIQNFLSSNDIKNNYMYDPNVIIIYENITNYTNGKDASGTFGTDLSDNKLSDSLATASWVPYVGNPVFGYNIYVISSGVKGLGIEIAIPSNCNVLWLLSLADRFVAFKICNLDNTVYGIYSGGKNNGNNAGGTVSSLINNNYSWIQIPLYWLNNDTPQAQRKVRLYNYLNKYPTLDYNIDVFYYSKIAFSSNPWNHVLITAEMVIYDTNSTTYIPIDSSKAVYTTTFIKRSNEIYYDPNYTNSGIFRPNQDTNVKVRIPIIKSGKNKILYFISINRSYNFDVLQVSLVNLDSSLTQLPNLKSSFSNPFATHYNSKMTNSYRATIISNSLIIPDSFGRTFITINIFLPFGSDFYIREFGTHDEN